MVTKMCKHMPAWLRMGQQKNRCVIERNALMGRCCVWFRFVFVVAFASTLVVLNTITSNKELQWHGVMMGTILLGLSVCLPVSGCSLWKVMRLDPPKSFKSMSIEGCFDLHNLS